MPRVVGAVVHAQHAVHPLVGEECAVAASVRSGELSAAESCARAGSVRADDSVELLADGLAPAGPVDCWAAFPAIEFAPDGLILAEYSVSVEPGDLRSCLAAREDYSPVA